MRETVRVARPRRSEPPEYSERGKAAFLGKGQRSKERQRAPFDKGAQGRCHRVECRKGRVMREARTILQLLRERGKKRLPLERVYRLLYNPDLFLMAYGRIYRNAGAMTKGTTEETADGMAQCAV